MKIFIMYFWIDFNIQQKCKLRYDHKYIIVFPQNY